MDLCSDGHEEICYESRACPLCDLETDLRGEIKDLEKNVVSLQDDIGNLEDEIFKLNE